MDDQGVRPSAQQVQDEVNKQNDELGQDMDDQEIEDVDKLHELATGHEHEDELPSDLPLGSHNVLENKPEDSDRPENNQ